MPFSHRGLVGVARAVGRLAVVRRALGCMSKELLRPTRQCRQLSGSRAVPSWPARPVRRGAAVPHAATTWKLRIPWKLRTHIACFISTGRRVSTLTADQAPMAGPPPCARSSWHHSAL